MHEKTNCIDGKKFSLKRQALHSITNVKIEERERKRDTLAKQKSERAIRQLDL